MPFTYDVIVDPWTQIGSGQFRMNVSDSSYTENKIYALVTVTCDSDVAPGSIEPLAIVHRGPSPLSKVTYNISVKLNCGGGGGSSSSGGADCAQYTTCDACTNSNSGTCGFCTGSKLCEGGTSNGPSSGSCPADHWRWVSSQCQN